MSRNPQVILLVDEEVEKYQEVLLAVCECLALKGLAAIGRLGLTRGVIR